MDTSDLQQRLSQLTQLLPSQRECLERLLFQLTFNQYQKVRIVGGPGSGKSMIALALAELFSEQFNIAMLDSRASQTTIPTQLMQQWFNRAAQAGIPLSEQVESTVSVLPLLLIVDDADQLSPEILAQLTQLDCMVFCFATAEGDNDDVTLLLNKLSSDDARQLLHSAHINDLELAQRLANADGNIHLLLQEPAKLSEAAPKQEAVVVKRYVSLLYVSTAVVVLMALWWALSEPDMSAVKQSTPAQPKPDVTMPVAETSEPDNVSTTDPQLVDTAEVAITETPLQTNTTVNPPTIEVSDETSIAADSYDEKVVADTEADSAADVVDSDVDLKAASVAQTTVETNTTTDTPGFGYDEAALLAMNKQAYALQLAVLSSEAALQRFKSAYPMLPVLAYSRSWQGQPQLVLLLAAFEDKTTAKAQIAALPAAIKATGPFIKSIAAIHNEINVRQSLNAGTITD